MVSRAISLAKGRRKSPLYLISTSLPLILSTTQQPGSEDEADGYKEACRSVAMFEDGGDDIGR